MFKSAQLASVQVWRPEIGATCK